MIRRSSTLHDAPPRARHATVGLSGLRTLWFNTGTLCNLTCVHCYIGISRNDAQALPTPISEVGFTRGEPFMNPEVIPLLTDTLRRGLPALVLTNAMRSVVRTRNDLAALDEAYAGLLTIRGNLDHDGPALPEMERGQGMFGTTVEGLAWLVGAARCRSGWCCSSAAGCRWP